MDRAGYKPTTGSRKLSRSQIKNIQKNMSRVKEVHAMAQTYEQREHKQLPPLDTLLANMDTQNKL